MRKTAVFLLCTLLLTTFGCRQRKHDIAYYEQQIDSIRKAEQLKELQRQTGVSDDPVRAFFDTLHLRSLPLQSEAGDPARLAGFSDMPAILSARFGYPDGTPLKAVALPRSHKRRVVMLAEMQDSITPTLYLYTLDAHCQPVDMLCIYEQKDEDRRDDFGQTYMEYYITSDYEITLMQFYLSHQKTKPELFQTRRFVISSEGKFEETVIEY